MFQNLTLYKKYFYKDKIYFNVSILMVKFLKQKSKEY